MSARVLMAGVLPRRLRWLAAGALSVLAATGASAQGNSLPADVQVALITKIMRFDRHLDRYGNEVVLGILYQGGNRESGRVARDVNEVARAVRTIGAGNQGFRTVLIEHASGSDVKAELRKHGVALLYLAPMRAVDLGRLIEQAHEIGVLTIAGESEPIQAGAAIGLQERGPRPAVSIRLGSARKAGSDLDSRLLHLADVQP